MLLGAHQNAPRGALVVYRQPTTWGANVGHAKPQHASEKRWNANLAKDSTSSSNSDSNGDGNNSGGSISNSNSNGGSNSNSNRKIAKTVTVTVAVTVAAA